jgi:hypothetical protein
MALTRKLLKSFGLEESVIESIIEAHGETVEALKRERDGYKTTADTAEAVAKERDEYKTKLEKAGDAAKVQADFDAYKQKVEQDKQRAGKVTALDALFESGGVKRKAFRDALLKVWDVDALEQDATGALKDADAIREKLKNDYPDFLAVEDDKGIPPTAPPAGGGKAYTRDELKGMSAEDINKNWDAVQKSLAALK